jgi:predicted transcriptional regulator
MTVRGYDVMRAVRASGLTSTQRHVLNAFALRCDDVGDCWASIITLADDTGFSERAVRVSVRALEEVHILTPTTVPGRSTTWRLNPDAILPRAEPRQRIPSPRQRVPKTPAVESESRESDAVEVEPAAPDLSHKDQPIDQPIDQASNPPALFSTQPKQPPTKNVIPRGKRSRKKEGTVGVDVLAPHVQTILTHYATCFPGDKPTVPEWDGMRRQVLLGSTVEDIKAFITGLATHPQGAWWRDNGAAQGAGPWRDTKFGPLLREFRRTTSKGGNYQRPVDAPAPKLPEVDDDLPF